MLLSVRLFFLQVYPTENVTSQYQNHQSEKISDSRYMILDTEGKDLMKYNKKYYLVIDKKPFSLNNYEETLENIMALDFIMKGENPDFNYTDIMKSEGKVYYDVSEETYNKINKLNNVKGIYTYAYDEVDRKKAWSVSTFLSNIKKEDEKIGNSLEADLNEFLKDNDIPRKNFYLDSKAVYGKSETEVSKENKNIKLTINKDIEEKIRLVLAKDEFKNLSNIGVTIMESDTGKIRAMVQKDESAANINLAIEGSGYEPGSVFKLITLATALDKGVITLGDSFTCTGNICKDQIHGRLTVEKALEKSCNDIFAKIGNEVGYNEVMDYAEKTGLFNRVLNIQGDGRNESMGIKPKESDGMNNISIGQCLTVSPIQILGATNAIINDGKYVKPYIVEDILDKDDNIIKSFNTEGNKIYSQTTSKLLKQSMQKVVKEGTGIKANVAGVELGGKTGSATSGVGNTHGWFSGYFKLNGKMYTMTVFVPDIEGKGVNGEDLGGGNTAAPIFAEVIKYLISK
ncbi:penicillin-binding transpeptidase domain-containing protein [Clostridium sp. LP20]